MKRYRMPLGFALVLACNAAAASGHEGKDGQDVGCGMHRSADEMFAMMDANKDGSISRAEFDQHREAMMKRHMELGEADEKEEEHEHGRD
jgi:hypothetical protein